MNDYAEKFAANLKRLRKKRGITQKEFADALGYSEKAVSKWECADSIPNIDALFAIAGVFDLKLDDLFKDTSEMYFLGIDGGGTKTSFALANHSGKILRTLHSDGCNPIDIGIDAAKKILQDGIYKITDGIALSSVVMYAGIAGGSSPQLRLALSDFFATLGFCAYDNGSDNNNIIAAGIGQRDGISIITGTGIFATAQKAGERIRVAGWGYLLDNGGSGYNVGRDGLNAYYCALDGSGPETALTAAIEAHTGRTPQDLLSDIYSGGKRKVASFAPLVYKVARTGDAVAAGIVERNMQCIAHVLETGGRQFTETPIPVMFAGGLSKEEGFLDAVRKHLHEPDRFALSLLPCEPVEGAVRLAMQNWKQSADNGKGEK